MDPATQLIEGIDLLGQLLEERGQPHDLVIIGGGALLLLDVIDRPTIDIDVVALGDGTTFENARPLPDELVQAVREVGRTLGLPTHDVEGKDWLNSGPAILLNMGLPEGFAERLQSRTFGGLTLHLPSLGDLVALKLWAATDIRRGSRRAVDLADLQAIGPSADDVRAGLQWCGQLDGRPDFWELDARPVLILLGFDPDEVIDG